MTIRRSTLALSLAIATMLPQAAAAQLRLARLIGDGMVMQRDARVPVWGWAAPGSTVSVTFGGRTQAATAGADGAWRVLLPAQPAGGPHEITVAEGDRRIVVRDVVFGDVWVASGQSNMEWTVADSKDAEREIASANDPLIRHFKVPQSFATTPEADLAGGAWEGADPEHVGGFTGVGYFFARDLRAAAGVPIGIVNTTWGGSRLEPWMSAAALGLDDAGVAEVERREQAQQAAILADIRARLGGDLPSVDGGMVDGRAVWADPDLDESGWAEIAVPSQWESAGYPGMDGVAWYRTTFELTEDEARRGIRLGLGMIDDSDVTWVNGVEVGRMDNGWNRARLYDVPASALRAGRNVIAVRVEDFQGGGGIAGERALVFVESDGARRPLSAPWKFRVGAVSIRFDGRANQVPARLYNKMIHPLLGFPIKGVIWYQGESNAGSLADAAAYRRLFPAMIRQWRRDWGSGDFPFLWVQLAAYMAPDAQPDPASTWAALRESQSATLSVPGTGQAIAIDLGEAEDIHPRNKQDVGRRLALAARAVAYGERVAHSGPVYRRHEVRDGRVVVEMEGSGGLVARGSADGEVRGFAIAGADRRWRWARARVEGGRVVVWSDEVPEPAAVRYAWGANPAGANLYERSGLPAGPFRTDDW